MSELFGAAIFPEVTVLTTLLIRLVLNLLFAAIVMRIAYTRLSQHREYLSTFLLVNVVTFSIAFLLSRSNIGLGLALGLFGVFGILRYRTEPIQVRHLTYLFVMIGLALLNALASQGVSLAELLIVNGTIIGTIALMESGVFSGREESRRVLYDRLNLLHPARATELLGDLRARTNLPVTRYETGDVDLLRDAVDIIVHFSLSPDDEQSVPVYRDVPAAKATGRSDASQNVSPAEALTKA